MGIPSRRVAVTPRLRRGYSVETSPRRRRGRDPDIPRRRVGAAIGWRRKSAVAPRSLVCRFAVSRRGGRAFLSSLALPSSALSSAGNMKPSGTNAYAAAALAPRFLARARHRSNRSLRPTHHDPGKWLTRWCRNCVAYLRPDAVAADHPRRRRGDVHGPSASRPLVSLGRRVGTTPGRGASSRTRTRAAWRRARRATPRARLSSASCRLCRLFPARYPCRDPTTHSRTPWGPTKPRAPRP